MRVEAKLCGRATVTTQSGNEATGMRSKYYISMYANCSRMRVSFLLGCSPEKLHMFQNINHMESIV